LAAAEAVVVAELGRFPRFPIQNFQLPHTLVVAVVVVELGKPLDQVVLAETAVLMLVLLVVQELYNQEEAVVLVVKEIQLDLMVVVVDNWVKLELLDKRMELFQEALVVLQDFMLKVMQTLLGNNQEYSKVNFNQQYKEKIKWLTLR
jgi:hypothetical protein